MDLFAPGPEANLLPFDGTVNYHGAILTPSEADASMATLITGIPWENDVTVMFGKRIVTARKVAWFADGGLSYSYSGTTKQALPWTPELLRLRELATRRTGATYNSCLLNLYHHGSEGMGWHGDDESTLVPGSSIAAISLGAERKFSFKHRRTKQTVSQTLENGSLLDMRGDTQKNWLHQLPKTRRVNEPRISLTFRLMA